jgi:uncharacterized protein (DUF849 family)
MQPVKSAADAARKILASEGVSGIYRGYGATLASFGPFSALYFMLYENWKALALRLRSSESETAALVAAAALDGHSRIGFENSLWNADGSLVAVAIMLLTTVGMVVFFWRRGWLKRWH